MAIGDVRKVRIFWDNDQTGKQVSTGFHMADSSIVAPDMVAIGDDIKAWWDVAGGGSAFKENSCDDIKLQSVTMQRVDPFEPLIELYAVSPTIPGTLLGDMAPAASAPLFSLRTALAGKRYRGRMYLPPTGEARLDSQGNLVNATVLDLIAQTDSLFAALLADRGEVGVYSSQAVVPGSDPPVLLTPVFTAWTETRGDKRPRSQRRRANRAPSYAA